MPLSDAGNPQTPAVSIIIPAYNVAPFIAEALDSVFGQRFQDFEVIVVNDGSTDTPALELALEPYWKRILYLKQENRGVGAARNTAIRQARGEFLAFLDGDDIWLPEYLTSQVNFLRSHPRVDASIVDVLCFDESGRERPWRMLKKECAHTVTFGQALKREAGQLPSAMVARRQSVVDTGLFDEHLRIGEDVDFYLRFCFPDRAIAYLGHVLVRHRERPHSITGAPRNRDWKQAEIDALRLAGRKLALSQAQRLIVEEEIASCMAALALADAHQHLLEHRLEDAGRCLRQANGFYRDRRISLALISLKYFPRWTARILHWRSCRE